MARVAVIGGGYEASPSQSTPSSLFTNRKTSLPPRSAVPRSATVGTRDLHALQ